MGTAQAGIYSGLGQGISNAGRDIMQALQFAQEQKLRQQQLGIQQQAQNRANTEQQQTAALQGFVDPNQVQPSTPQPSGSPPPDTSGVLSPVGGLTGPMPGVLSALQSAQRASQGQGGPVPQIGGAPGPTNAATATGQLGGYDTSRYVPAPGGKFLDVTGAPAVQRQMAVMKALQDAEFARSAALRQIPEAMNPEDVALRKQQLAQTGTYQTGELANRAREIGIQGDIKKTLMGLTLGKTGETYAGDFAKRTQDDRKAGEIGQQLEDAYGQATGATTPDGKPNASALKSLIVNQIAGTEPGMQVRLGTLNFNGTGGDKSLAGSAAAKVMVAINGLPPQQQLAALHNVFGQMNATKMQRYVTEYQAEAAAHPEIPNYEANYLRPTMAPEFVFGVGAKAATDWKSTLSDAQTALAHGADLQHIRARYKTLTGRNYDTDAGTGNGPAPSQ